MDQKPTSLLIITADSPESYSPAGERLRNLALASGSKFNKVMVLALQRSKEKGRQESRESKVSLYTVNFSRAVPFPFSVLFDPVKMLMLLVHSLVLYNHIKPSHVLASMPPLETGLSAWLLTRFRHAKLVIDLRDDWESAVGTMLEPYFPRTSMKVLSVVANKIYSAAFAIFAVTQTIADTLRRRGVATSILLVPNGADTSIFTSATSKIRVKIRLQRALPLEKLVFVYCGNGISPYYRLDLILSSVKTLPENVVEKLFFVFYVYNGLESLNKLKRQLAIPDGVMEIRNPLPRNQLAQVLAACDVGLVPFDARPYLLCARSTKLYEYLSAGLFVISSGPKNGELDTLFSTSSVLGSFSLPSTENFTRSFTCLLRNAEDMLNNEKREIRNSFIRRNYDRRSILKEAMTTILEHTN